LGRVLFISYIVCALRRIGQYTRNSFQKLVLPAGERSDGGSTVVAHKAIQGHIIIVGVLVFEGG